MTKCSDIIDAEPSSHQEEREEQLKKNDVKVQYRDPKRSSQFHHEVDGNIVGYKARFVAQGFSQKEGIDYEETFIATGSEVT